MDLTSIVGVAAGLAGLMSTSLEVQRRVTDRQLDTRGDRLRTRTEELAKFLQLLTQLLHDGGDEQVTQQAISSTKTDLDNVLKELVGIQQVSGRIKVDDMSAIRRWLLLFAPARRFAWVLHFGFYFTVWLAVLCIFEFKAASASYLVPVMVLVTGICSFVVLAVLLRYWAVMEMRWAEGFVPSPSPTRRSILWYRPASRREMIARAAIVFGLFQFASSIPVIWISRFREALTFTQLSVTLVAFYAWSLAELSLAHHPVDMKFPRNLRFLQWPQNRIAWFWMICFYFMAGSTVFAIKQLATGNIIQGVFRHDQVLHISALIGLAIGFPLSYLLPMYALNRILLAQSEQKGNAPLKVATP